jgi:hypothetical protein
VKQGGFLLIVHAILKWHIINIILKTMKKKKTSKQKAKRWSDEENQILLRQIDAFPHNLAKCFTIVAEQTGRSKSACAAHWYTKLSKDPNVWKFVTLSAHHCSRNRKNGIGTESDGSIWNKVLKIVKTLFK